jgi:hypothetical protein
MRQRTMMEWAEQRKRVEAALDYSEEVIAEKVTEEKLQETFRLLLGGVARYLANLDQGPDSILEQQSWSAGNTLRSKRKASTTRTSAPSIGKATTGGTNVTGESAAV